jgi:anti-sigma-K factor RskA
MMNDETDDLDTLAGEYALGTLTGEDRHRFEARMAADPRARALVDAWNQRLVPLIDVIEPTAPPPEVWGRIRAAIDAAPVPLAAPRRASVGRRAWGSLPLWRGLALAATAAAAVLAVMVATREAAPPAGRYVAILQTDAASPAWVVTVDLAAESLSVRPVEATAPAGHAYELWLVAGGQPPRSLGLLDPVAGHRLPLPAGALPDDAVLAVSLEPETGSPTGQPTGPVVHQGRLLREP